MISVRALREAVGTAPDGVVEGLNCFGYVPDMISPPSFFPFDVEIDRTAGGGRTFGATRGYHVNAMVATSSSDDRAGQELLDRYLSEGNDESIIDAIEADPTLGGIAKSLNVERVDGYRIYTIGKSEFYGARLRVFVIG